MCCLRARRMGGKGERITRILLHSCRKAAWGLTQPALPSLLSPLKQKRLPTRLDWLDLPVEHSPIPGGFFPDATS